MKPKTKDAYKLFHNGMKALAIVEQAGMRIDTERLLKTIDSTRASIKEKTSELKKDEVWETWRRRFGEKTKMGSRDQLAQVLFKEMKMPGGGKTPTGKQKMDVVVLEGIDHPFVKGYLRIEKLKKLLSTYLLGVRREAVNDFVHPSFNLNMVRTFRSSCDKPNFQNIPIRDPEIGKLIRSCFIPRDGHVLVEVDFSALEFSVGACLWKDKAMVAYASDPSLDIHRDMAAECYCLHPTQVNKDVRFYAKNQFVFPTLYGSYYVNCARNLWNAIAAGDLRGTGNNTLFDCLEEIGIKELGACDPKMKPKRGTFEKHIMEVEEAFCDRFPQWAERKEIWWDRYQERGWFNTMTGFQCRGHYTRNDCYNYPIQGPAFHLLLWSLIQMVKWMDGMKSCVIGQIHDSILMDVHKDELDEVIEKVTQVMTVDVRKHWDWIITPLSIEIETSETTWFDKEAIAV